MRRAWILPLIALSFSGCLFEPPIEEEWTLLEVVEATPVVASAFEGGAVTVNVKARLTYRELLTGFVVAELRQSSTLTADDTRFENREGYLDIARDVDLVLTNSTAVGSSNRAVTGFDHLVQEIDLSFTASVSQAPQAAVNPDQSATPRMIPGLFLVVYFSDNIEEVELESGEEIEVIHPVFSTERDILSTGLELTESEPSF